MTPFTRLWLLVEFGPALTEQLLGLFPTETLYHLIPERRLADVSLKFLGHLLECLGPFKQIGR